MKKKMIKNGNKWKESVNEWKKICPECGCDPCIEITTLFIFKKFQCPQCGAQWKLKREKIVDS